MRLRSRWSLLLVLRHSPTEKGALGTPERVLLVLGEVRGSIVWHCRALSSSCFLFDSACASDCSVGSTCATHFSHDVWSRHPRPILPHQTSACPRTSTHFRHEVARPRIPRDLSRSGADPPRRTTRRPRQTPSRFHFVDFACRCDSNGDGCSDGDEESCADGWWRSCAFQPARISVRRPSLLSLGHARFSSPRSRKHTLATIADFSS